MTFYRTRIIKGRPYLYQEWRWREGGKVRSRSRIVQALDMLVDNLRGDPLDNALAVAMADAEAARKAAIEAEKAKPAAVGRDSGGSPTAPVPPTEAPPLVSCPSDNPAQSSDSETD